METTVLDFIWQQFGIFLSFSCFPMFLHNEGLGNKISAPLTASVRLGIYATLFKD